MKNNKNAFLKSLLKELTTPAYGCTEIGIVAYACATAAKTLKSNITKADVYVSPYIYRNDANVGVPHMGKVGIETIAAAGFIVKNPKGKLSVLSTINKEQCEKAIDMGNKNIIKVHVDLHCDPVFVKVVAVDAKKNTCEVLIEGQHDVIRRIKLNNTILEQNQSSNKQQVGKYKYNVDEISLSDIYHCVLDTKLSELKFLEKGVEMNHKVKQHGMDNKDHFTDATHKTVTTSWEDKLMLLTTAAISSRMLGCPLPVMASNDSGDHGLTVNLPQHIYHTCENTSELLMYQAIAFANLITWKIKKNIGSLSAYCGSVVAAATATISGIALQKKFNLKQINDLINFCICSYAGILCDGAKLSCSWKVQSALLVGFQALKLVENHSCLPDSEGIINKDAFESIKHLGNLSKAIKDPTNNELISIIEANLKSQKK